jgi:hypothetical protein
LHLKTNTRSRSEVRTLQVGSLLEFESIDKGNYKCRSFDYALCASLRMTIF